jgi:uncharacterized ion transporter superfamily protein YfcC
MSILALIPGSWYIAEHAAVFLKCAAVVGSIYGATG